VFQQVSPEVEALDRTRDAQVRLEVLGEERAEPVLRLDALAQDEGSPRSTTRVVSVFFGRSESASPAARARW
jgi:hypothetical protein